MNPQPHSRKLRPMLTPSIEFFFPANGTTKIQWRRSDRARRISLRIDPRKATVIVTLPTRAAAAAGHELVIRHFLWIKERIARLPPHIILEDGARLPLNGRHVRIRHTPEALGTRLVGHELLVSGAAEFLPRRVTDFLRLEAQRRMAPAAITKAQNAGLKANRVTVKDTQSRWGSCTADGTLMFNWRLIMAPPNIQDYVVAHEVAHLRHMDHSPRFWAFVDTLTPHRIEATTWLGDFGTGLMRVG